jgi:GT2 family glycosyltransferase
MPQAGEKINCMSTRGLFLRVSDFLELKGFRSRLLPHYYSDYEFTIRAGRRGFNLMVSDKLRLWMNEASTGTGIIKSESTSGFIRQYFSKKYTDQPVYTLNFILLTFPYPYKIKFAWRHLKNTFKTLIKLLLNKPVPN